MPAASLHALVAQSIDYAGMFSPCSLGLEPALQNQAEYVRSPDAWMLGAFVLSIDQFNAAKQLLSKFDPLHPLRVAALGPKTGNIDTFLDALEDAGDAGHISSADQVHSRTPPSAATISRGSPNKDVRFSKCAGRGGPSRGASMECRPNRGHAGR